MEKKVTRIKEVSLINDNLRIVGDLYIEGNLTIPLRLYNFGDFKSLFIDGNLWIDGNAQLKFWSITAKNIMILGGCKAETLKSTTGDIYIGQSDMLCVHSISSAKDVIIESLTKAQSNSQICSNNVLEGIKANGNVIISSSLIIGRIDNGNCISYIKAKNIYGENLTCNNLTADGMIYLKFPPKSISSNLPKIAAKEIIIEN